MVALRRQAAVQRARPDRNQDLAVGAELAQHVHVLGVADAALDEADVAGPALLDVGERRAVELDMLDQAFFVRQNSRLGCQIHLSEEIDGIVLRLAPEA